MLEDIQKELTSIFKSYPTVSALTFITKKGSWALSVKDNKITSGKKSKHNFKTLLDVIIFLEELYTETGK